MNNNFIPLSVPNIKGNEIKYVTDALEKEWVSTGGEYIDQFEFKIAEYLNVKNAVACQSGTSALHLSLIQSGVEIGDEVIVPTLTFIAAVNPIKYCFAHPVFMDCDNSLTIDIYKTIEFCENQCAFDGEHLINKKTKRVVKAIIVVHVFGNMCNMEKIMELSSKYNLKVIEDATEALGTYFTQGIYKGKFAGTIGDFGCYSFNGNKIITTGGGGMIVAKDENDLRNIKYLSTQAKDDNINYIHNEIGYNYRMTNIQAALGVAQLEKIEEFILIKKRNFEKYKNEINNIDGIHIIDFNENIRSNYWFYSLVIENKNIKKDWFMKKLSESNIQTRPIWGLIHEQKPYFHCESYKIEKAYDYYNKVLNLPCSTNLELSEVKTVIETIKEILD
ncbi:LegC family aminotransferase [Clostridium butyricum]|uniref:Aminotransferase DegT n=1 Tax=Clostridium butyricum TaxID=1492 RepID=A0A2S7FA76_CLOBU|nr:LegC family aminotransferase [Clostridium butyricum]KHD15808.1 aminotransferase DegT [Clostridium butyricum]PPV14651.1 aminotransferase DegT [Clostridium butyricum]